MLSKHRVDGAALNAIKNAAKAGDWAMVGIEAARMSLRYTISNEETIYSEIMSKARSSFGTKMLDSVDRKCAIDKMMTLNLSSFTEINLGWQCWYLSRVWGLMRLAEAATFQECKKNFLGLVPKCRIKEIADFVQWMIGPDYERADFLEMVQKLVKTLLPPLISLVYDYLAPPSADLVRQKILSFI